MTRGAETESASRAGTTIAAAESFVCGAPASALGAPARDLAEAVR